MGACELRRFKSTRVKIGKRLKKARESKGLTQVGAADLVGIPRRSWMRIENGLGSVPLEFMPMLSAKLDITCYDLVNV